MGLLRRDFDREQSGIPRITVMVGVAINTLGSEEADDV